jgi:hypothetical protein
MSIQYLAAIRGREMDVADCILRLTTLLLAFVLSGCSSKTIAATSPTGRSMRRLCAVVEAAGIELQSENRSKRKRVAPTVAPKMLG